MIEAGIYLGDLLIVDHQISPASGKIVVATINGELTVKRLIKNKGQLLLVPDNPNYSAIEINEDTNFMIWGVVTNSIHPL